MDDVHGVVLCCGGLEGAAVSVGEGEVLSFVRRARSDEEESQRASEKG